MDISLGLERKGVKGKPGVHVHFYSSQNPKVYNIEPNELPASLSAENLCITMFRDENFKFDETEYSDNSKPAAIYPASMHLFQLWDVETGQYKAPNDEISLSETVVSCEFVLRIRFKYPPSSLKQNFGDVWESGAFYYYFLQCRHDFIYDILHDVYHCHVKEDLCIGLAVVDMARLAFEKKYSLRQLKDKYAYHTFLPRHIAKKTRNPIVRRQLKKPSDSALEETYENFQYVAKSPHRHSVVSYLMQLLPSVPEYANEEFAVKSLSSKAEKLVVHPYDQKSPAIYLDYGKNSLELVGHFSSLTAIDLRECNVLLHFTDSKPQHLELVDVHQARSFVAMLDGYYRLMYDYHYLLSDLVYSPIVKLWNELKCYGPLSLHGQSKEGPQKDYLKVVWRRNACAVVEGSFLIKQRSSSFTDYVLIVHKMGRNYPAIRIIYDESNRTYSCDSETMKQLFQSQYREQSFNSVRDLIKYYRSGDFKPLKLTSQLSPVPKEDIPLMVCRDRHQPKAELSASTSLDLQNIESPTLLSPMDVQLGKSVHVSLMFDLMEGTYGKEKVLIKQVKSNIQNRDRLTVYFQSDVEKVMRWNHINIVRVYGLCLSPFYVMSQRMWEGRLDHLLKKKASSFKLHHCVQATGQLAQALMYLEAHTFTHGAIRCKSILVSSFDSHGDIEIKLAGDMMAAYMSSLPLTDKLNIERLPWIALERWTALTNETTESDVYSFGMTIWEICSRGERPLGNLNLDKVRSFIESSREIAVPSIIEAYNSAMHTYKDVLNEERYNKLMSVLYRRIILHNISVDPSSRMKPQDIVREMILLNCQFTPNAYDPIGKAMENSISAVSISSTHNGTEQDTITNNSGDSLSDRPLPSIPLPAPPTQAHIISAADLIGFENGSALKLGQGFYGEVYLCKLRQSNGRPSIECAVKKLINKERDDEVNEAQLKEFERELKLMVPLAHKNIVRMYGECFYPFRDGQESRMIVMEYVRCGSLSQFVKNDGKRIPSEEREQLYKRFCLDIAEGMIFLHNISETVSIIHRDLAARNVLITNEPHVAKITDFGLARTLSEKDYYRCSRSSVLPFLWCAPESMTSDVFTKASDVWSYAVVIWEMFSGGKRPYIKSVKTKVRGTMDLKHLTDVLSSSAPNSRLPKLPELSSELYSLMMKCWQTKPADRPTFESIKTQLQNII
ncbi:tyrosine-protein kinase JAK2-like isoform X2 [Watersipora subatra]|uniref:tyrosine-protein kinase JAK2-like isoform X2 n=1 Tax=Watersipora subatra TaxID=2589382 RepID=UPI00355AF671